MSVRVCAPFGVGFAPDAGVGVGTGGRGVPVGTAVGAGAVVAVERIVAEVGAGRPITTVGVADAGVGVVGVAGCPPLTEQPARRITANSNMRHAVQWVAGMKSRFIIIAMGILPTPWRGRHRPEHSDRVSVRGGAITVNETPTASVIHCGRGIPRLRRLYGVALPPPPRRTRHRVPSGVSARARRKAPPFAVRGRKRASAPVAAVAAGPLAVIITVVGAFFAICGVVVIAGFAAVGGAYYGGTEVIDAAWP